MSSTEQSEQETTSHENTRGAGGQPDFNGPGAAEDSQGRKTPVDTNGAGLADDGIVKADPVQDNNTGDRPDHAEVVEQDGDLRVRQLGREGREVYVLERMMGSGNNFTRIGGTHATKKDALAAMSEAD